MGPRWQIRLDLDPQSASEMTHPEVPWQFQGTVKRPRSGRWPKSWKSPPLPQNSWTNPSTHLHMKLPSLLEKKKTVVLEKILESPLDCKEIQPVHLKGNQSWIFIGRTDVEAETPILWPPHTKNWLIWKDLDAGKDWRQEEKGTTEDEKVGWHPQLSGHEFE